MYNFNPRGSQYRIFFSVPGNGDLPSTTSRGLEGGLVILTSVDLGWPEEHTHIEDGKLKHCKSQEIKKGRRSEHGGFRVSGKSITPPNAGLKYQIE